MNVQMLTNVLASALTATVSSVLTYLAAWSHFSSADNSALAAIIAGGLSMAIGQVVTIAINRWSVLVDRVTQGGRKLVVPDQKEADSLPNNPNIVGPADVKLTKVMSLILVALCVSLLLPGAAFAQTAAQRAAQRNDANRTAVSPLVLTAPAPADPAKCPLIIDPLKLCGLLTGKPQDDAQRVADRIRLASSDDIAYAIAKATAAKTPASTMRLLCLNAIKAAHDQASGAAVKKPDGSDWPRPNPAALTAIEDVAELIDNLSPQGVLFTSCAGAAQMFKTDILTVINAFVTGSAAIAATPLGL